MLISPFGERLLLAVENRDKQARLDVEQFCVLRRQVGHGQSVRVAPWICGRASRTTTRAVVPLGDFLLGRASHFVVAEA